MNLKLFYLVLFTLAFALGAVTVFILGNSKQPMKPAYDIDKDIGDCLAFGAMGRVINSINLTQEDIVNLLVEIKKSGIQETSDMSEVIPYYYAEILISNPHTGTRTLWVASFPTQENRIKIDDNWYLTNIKSKFIFEKAIKNLPIKETHTLWPPESK